MCATSWVFWRTTFMTCILVQSTSTWCATSVPVCRTRSEFVVEWKGTWNGAHGRYLVSPQRTTIHFVSFVQVTVSIVTSLLKPQKKGQSGFSLQCSCNISKKNGFVWTFWKFRPLINIKMSIEHQGMRLAVKNWSTHSEASPSTTLHATNIHWLSWGLNQDCKADKQVPEPWQGHIEHEDRTNNIRTLWTAQITHWP